MRYIIPYISKKRPEGYRLGRHRYPNITRVFSNGELKLASITELGQSKTYEYHATNSKVEIEFDGEPKGEWEYEYDMETPVSCKTCKKLFPASELKSMMGCGRIASNTICPYCDEHWCCEIEYEK